MSKNLLIISNNEETSWLDAGKRKVTIWEDSRIIQIKN